MNVLLNDEPVIQTGTFEIRRIVTVNVTAEEARRRVHRWLLLEVSHLMGAEEPTLVVGDSTCWHVPVHLSTPQSGVVGQIGFVQVNAVTGQLLDPVQHKNLLEQRAQSMMTTQPTYQTKRLLQEVTTSYEVPRAPKITLDENDFPIVTTT